MPVDARAAVLSQTLNPKPSYLQMSVDTRAAVQSLSSSSAAGRDAMHGLCGQLEDDVSGLGEDLDVFMRRQSIKVETQVSGSG